MVNGVSSIKDAFATGRQHIIVIHGLPPNTLGATDMLRIGVA